MTGVSIADLAVLGIASEGPIEPGQIATVAKALVPELWQPTGNVIDTAIERNLYADLLRRTGNHPSDEHLTVTTKGTEKIRALLLHPPETLAPSAVLAAEAAQFCFLNATDTATAAKVLTRFQGKLRDRLAAFERRSAQCPYGGRYSNYWIGMEQLRLEAMVQFVATIQDEAATLTTERHCAPETAQ